MDKLLVDRELLDSAATWLEVHAPGGGCVEGSVAEDLRAILEQPAEAEGVEVVAWGWECFGEHVTADKVQAAVLHSDGVELEPLMSVSQHQRILSAVTAERDRLLRELEQAHRAVNSECMDWAREYERRKKVQVERDQLSSEIDGLREAETLLLSVCNDLMRHENADVRMVTCIELNNWLTKRAAMAAKEE